MACAMVLRKRGELDESKHERTRLQEALRLNQPLATAYYLKEELRTFWSQADKEEAKVFLEGWVARAQQSGIPIIKRFATRLASLRSGLLAYYDHRITSGRLEGMNNKIKTMQRQAYGYRDQEYFVLKIYALHEKSYELIG